MAREIVTLCIEDTVIRMVAFKGKAVVKWSSLPLEPGLVKDGVVLDKEAVSQRIREFFAGNGVSTREVIASVSGIHSLYRLLSLPPTLPKRILPEAVEREAGRVLPVALEELYLSWQALPMPAETLVCLVGLPRQTVDTLLDTLRLSGLKPYLMDVKPLAMTRAVDKADAIVIDIQPVDFDILIMLEGIPQLWRTLPFAKEDLFPAEKLTTLKEELERTIRYYNSEHQENPLPADMSLFLSGEIDAFTGLLSQAFQYRLEILPTIVSSPEGFNQAQYLTNIGLALKEIKVKGIPLRLDLCVLPTAYIPRPFPVWQSLFLFLLVLGMGVFLFFAVSASQRLAGETVAMQVELEQARLMLQKRQAAPEVEKLEARLRSLEASRNSLNQVLEGSSQSQSQAQDDLSTVVDSLPPEVNLNRVIYGGGLTLNGTAESKQAVLEYGRALQKSGRFSQVLLSSLKVTEDAEISYILILE